jgi:hydroxymethylbilane synthase
LSRLRIGARGSRLSIVQYQIVADALRAHWPSLEIEFVPIETKGDLDPDTPLTEGTGWFTSAIQQALAAGRVDVAVHSYKDLPTKRPDGLVIAAIPAREDPRDALVSRDGKRLRDLPPGARVGTSSPRRGAQVRAINPALEVVPIRGNVDTRVRKVVSGEYDAAVLALAGLRRLGLEGAITATFGYEELLPAPAQGALAVECRGDDADTLKLLRAIDVAALRAAVGAERSFLATLEAGCSFPAAAYAEIFGSTIKVHGMVAPGGTIIRTKVGGPVEAAAGLGRSLAEELMRRGGM